MEKVELNPAYVWTCPYCGEDNWQRAIIREVAREDDLALYEELGIDPDSSDIRIRSAIEPTTVHCNHCEGVYEAVNLWSVGEEDIEEDDDGELEQEQD
jgi:hypothetical protein